VSTGISADFGAAFNITLFPSAIISRSLNLGKNFLAKSYAKKIVCIGRDVCPAQFVSLRFVTGKVRRKQERVSVEIIR
jgi:hypothetical protein